MAKQEKKILKISEKKNLPTRILIEEYLSSFFGGKSENFSKEFLQLNKEEKCPEEGKNS